jgi:hypothetical protein
MAWPENQPSLLCCANLQYGSIRVRRQPSRQSKSDKIDGEKIFMKTKTIVTNILLGLSLAACVNHSVKESTIIAAIEESNIEFAKNANGRPSGTWRWPGTPSQPVTVFLVAPNNQQERDYADKVNRAIAQINASLYGLVLLTKTEVSPSSGNYIRVSYGTSYVPNGSHDYSAYCSNVSTGPGLGVPIVPDAKNGIAATPVYINLGNGHCDVTVDMVTHEFGHALGLAKHFDGFGRGGTSPISNLFWDVLATLYANPASTLAGSISVRRAR